MISKLHTDSLDRVKVTLGPESMESSGEVRVAIQDRTNDILDLKLTQKIATIVLAVDSVIDANQITLATGHGVVVGNVINIYESGRFFQCVATVVATDLITIDSNLDFAYSTKAIAERATDQLAVDGSTTKQVFFVNPHTSLWHITGISFSMTDNAAMDDSQFGGIPGLANGILVRKKDDIYKNLMNIKTNLDFQLHCIRTNYASKAPSGFFGFSAVKDFQGQNGIVIELDGAKSDQFQVIVQDNLTGLTSFKCLVFGHKVV